MATPLPPDFVKQMQTLLGDDPAFADSLSVEVPVSIRINREKTNTIPQGEPVPWCNTGFYLQQRIPFTFDPLFHAGAYYVQEAASMFLEQAIQTYVQEPAIALDLCAAPGGKSTHLASLLPGGSLLVANEVIRSRSHILAENMAKWGNSHTIVTQNDPARIGNLTETFDLIVADLPCSGEGMFRKDPNSRSEWSTANVALCAARQRRIISDCWPALKPGGLLIYSTCTFNTAENEDNIDFIIREMQAEALPIPTPETWGISGALKHSAPVYRFFPHRTKGEGFFLAILRKHGEPTCKKEKKIKSIKPTYIPEQVKAWLSNPGDFHIQATAQKLTALPLAYLPLIHILSDELNILSAGISLGEIKGKDLIPSHALALSRQLNAAAFPCVELSWEQAIRYLRKEAFPIPAATKGYNLVTYSGLPLGFVKNIGNRANNLYPQEWRIRSTHMPDEVPMLF